LRRPDGFIARHLRRYHRSLNKPTTADPKNASGGKKIHRPEADIFISNREENPPTHRSLSFRQKKIHFIPPLTVTDYLLDTSFLIAYFNEVADRTAGPARRFRAVMPARARLYVSLASMAELLEGAEDPEETERHLTELARLLGLHRPHARRACLDQNRARSSLHPSQIPMNLAQSPRRKAPHPPCAVLLAQLGRLRPFSLEDLGQSSSVL
jgi:predicted nucleic acid-binding protein